MALYATNRFAGDGTTTSYEFNFVGKYIARTHVKVYQEDNATKVRTSVSINDSNFLNDTTLHSLPVTPVGSTLVIYRETPKPPLVDFVNGSRFTEYNLDLVARQGLFVAMEALDAGDAEARQQLLDAIAVIVGLSDDATAAALAAATSASNSAGSATLAQDAKVAAEAANSAAQTARSVAQASATAASASASNASTSASSASTSASNAAGSASSAASSASAASTQATNATTSATNAANSATAAAGSASAAASSASAASASATAAAGSAASINPATFMTLANAQTVSGDKTFSIAPTIPSITDPASSAGRALNWASIRARTVLNGWGVQADVTNNAVYMGWSGFPRGILAQVDSTTMGSVVTTAAARDTNMIGALVFAHYNVRGSTIGAGAAVNGVDLRPASPVNNQGVSLPGVWTCLGYCVGTTDATSPAAKTLFIRTS